MTNVEARGPWVAQSPDDMPKRDQWLELSGLEFVAAMRDGAIPLPPIYGQLGFEIEEVDPGRVQIRGRPGFLHLNPQGTVHGGWYGAILDSCMTCAAQTHLPAGRNSPSLEYKVNMLRPILPSKEEVLAIGEAVHVGRRTATAEGRIVGADSDKLYATASVTCLVVDAV